MSHLGVIAIPRAQTADVPLDWPDDPAVFGFAARWLGAFFRSCHQVGLELALLHRQLSVFKRKNPRPRLGRFDRAFWVFPRRFWRRWSEVMIVKPENRSEVAW